MKVLAHRGKDQFLVEQDGTFYMANLMYGEAIASTPPSDPAIFVKAGYWEDAVEVDDKTMAEIEEAMQHVREVPKAD